MCSLQKRDPCDSCPDEYAIDGKLSSNYAIDWLYDNKEIILEYLEQCD